MNIKNNDILSRAMYATLTQKFPTPSTWRLFFNDATNNSEISFIIHRNNIRKDQDNFFSLLKPGDILDITYKTDQLGFYQKYIMVSYSYVTSNCNDSVFNRTIPKNWYQSIYDYFLGSDDVSYISILKCDSDI